MGFEMRIKKRKPLEVSSGFEFEIRWIKLHTLYNFFCKLGAFQ